MKVDSFNEPPYIRVVKEFLLYLAALAGTLVVLALMIRYGFKAALQWDRFASRKVRSRYSGLPWALRIKWSVVIRGEYFFYLLLGRDSYFKSAWWPMKMTALPSILLFIAGLFRRSSFNDFYERIFLQHDLSHVFDPEKLVWYLNTAHLIFLIIFLFLIIESIRMHSWLFPVRLVIYSILTILTALFNMLGLIVFLCLVVFYLIFAFIRNIIFPNSTGSILSSNTLRGHYHGFVDEYYNYGSLSFPTEYDEIRQLTDEAIDIKKPIQRDPELPRFYPDNQK